MQKLFFLKIIGVVLVLSTVSIAVLFLFPIKSDIIKKEANECKNLERSASAERGEECIRIFSKKFGFPLVFITTTSGRLIDIDSEDSEFYSPGKLAKKYDYFYLFNLSGLFFDIVFYFFVFYVITYILRSKFMILWSFK